MIEHLTQIEVGDYCLRQLSPAALLKVADHIGTCESCRQWIDNELGTDAVFLALRSEVLGEGLTRSHATAEQTAGYVDGTLRGEERQTVADHLSSCELCAVAVYDIGAFRDQIWCSLDRQYHPAVAPPLRTAWWNGAVASLAVAFGARPAGLAIASIIAVVLLAITSWFVWRTMPGKPNQESVASSIPPSQPEAPPAARVVVQVHDGTAMLAVDETGKLSGADNLPLEYQVMLTKALISQRIGESPQLNGLTRAYSPMMSGEKKDADFGLIGPVGKVLFTDRPTFRWSPLQGAAGYVVEIYDSEFNLAATSPELTQLSWAVPPLPRGTVYTWQVKAMKDGQEIRSPRPPAPQARFRIVDQAKTNELLNARRVYPSSHLALGLLYAEAGLLEEAEQELRTLKRANPDSEIVRRLLGQIQAMRRR